MLFIPINALRPGMVLARDVRISLTQEPIIRAGEALSEKDIQELCQRCNGIYIDFETTKGCFKEDLSNELSNEPALQHLRKFYSGEENSFDYTSLDKLVSKLINANCGSGQLINKLSRLQAYDDYTYKHCIRVGLICLHIGTAMNLNSKMLNELVIAGMLHDIGKARIDLAILNKPARLTVEEGEIILDHPQKGYDICKMMELNQAVCNGVLSHHESFNGSGYPMGTVGENIPLYGRIISIADIYDALTSKRSYKEAYDPIDALRYIKASSGSQFDPKIIDIFLSLNNFSS